MKHSELFNREDLIDQYGIYPLLVVKNQTSFWFQRIENIHKNRNQFKCGQNKLII